jgi:undecaprenyl-diphosphatase
VGGSLRRSCKSRLINEVCRSIDTDQSRCRLRYKRAGGCGRRRWRVIILKAEAPKINPFDVSIIHFINQFAQRSWLFDTSLYFISENALIKGGAITALFWWAWFREGEGKTRRREFIVSGLAMAFVSLFVARALALWLPFRERPLRVAALNFHLPIGITDSNLIHWSSFPSDHAALFFSLATSIYFISRRLGLLAYCHAFFIVCLPRVYLGLHFPTDILSGALLGIGITDLCLIKHLRTAIARKPLAWSESAPAYFYASFYLVLFLIATNFDSLRETFVFAWGVITGSARPH